MVGVRWRVISETEIFAQSLLPVELSYTSGLVKYDHPELLLTGLDPVLAQGLLRAAVAAVESGNQFVPGSRYPGLVRNYDIEVRPVSRFQHQVLEQTSRAYEILGLKSWSAAQLVWPDADGSYPWDWGWGGGDAQPLFSVPD